MKDLNTLQTESQTMAEIFKSLKPKTLKTRYSKQLNQGYLKAQVHLHYIKQSSCQQSDAKIILQKPTQHPTSMPSFPLTIEKTSFGPITLDQNYTLILSFFHLQL